MTYLENKCIHHKAVEILEYDPKLECISECGINVITSCLATCACNIIMPTDRFIFLPPRTPQSNLTVDSQRFLFVALQQFSYDSFRMPKREKNKSTYDFSRTEVFGVHLDMHHPGLLAAADLLLILAFPPAET